MRNCWNWKYPLSNMYPAHTQLVAKCSSPSIGDRRATGCVSHISTTDRKALITQLLFQSTLVSFPTRWYLYWPPISRPYTFTNWTRHLGAFDLLWTLWLSHLSSWPLTPTQTLRHWDKRYSSTLNVLIAIRQTFCQVKDTSCSHIFWINTEICFFVPNPLVTFIVIIWNRD